MPRLLRLDLYNQLLATGLLPLFYHDDSAVAVDVVAACAAGGAKLIEFTNRGPLAYPVFLDLARHFAAADPSVILGIGSIQDAPTAALFIAAGAQFIVGPNFNPEIARLCNRRKIAYLPGCATETEIATAEEWGAEICKLFPGESVGGPGFVKAVMAPCPWHRLMPTGGVDATEASIGEWIRAGAAAVGMGSKLISPAVIREHDYAELSRRAAQCIAWVQAARAAA